MTPPPPPHVGIYNVLLFRNSLVLEALLQTVKSCINSIPHPPTLLQKEFKTKILKIMVVDG